MLLLVNLICKQIKLLAGVRRWMSVSGKVANILMGVLGKVANIKK